MSMWYCHKLYHFGDSSCELSVSEDLLMDIKCLETGEVIHGYYKDLKSINIIGVLEIDNIVYACVVNPLSLGLTDYIEDIKIVRNIPRKSLRFLVRYRPLTNLYLYRHDRLDYSGLDRIPCVFITDVILDLFMYSSMPPSSILDIFKKSKVFYLDCFDCSNKLKITVNDKFFSYITKFILLRKAE